ncbi:MAG: hypothetical protein KGQ40_16730 [Rhodospirillales bacterium]|nr:hypothetical protein [Rhodospirillales bacterium]
MGGTICFTSFTLSYLARARVLARSVKRAHPDWAMWALLVDVPPGDLAADALEPFDAVVRADGLGIAGFSGWMFRHDLVEACTAVKAPMLERLLAAGAEKVIYLDPDIAVFHPLSAIEQRLDGASIVLTPHQLAPNESEMALRDNELTSLQYGVFNLGFLGVRNDQAGRDFARWWSAMTARACYDDVEAGLFTDQKYCDLVPGLFGGVHIERDPGCNVASWNLSRRRLEYDAAGRLRVNGAALLFYHFTKIDGVGAAMTERYAQDDLAVYDLLNWYRRAVRDETVAGLGAWYYGFFESGAAIPRAARLVWRARADLWARFEDPFAGGAAGYETWLRDEMPGLMES